MCWIRAPPVPIHLHPSSGATSYFENPLPGYITPGPILFRVLSDKPSAESAEGHLTLCLPCARYPKSINVDPFTRNGKPVSAHPCAPKVSVPESYTPAHIGSLFYAGEVIHSASITMSAVLLTEHMRNISKDLVRSKTLP
jgi:hypothetical protein